MKNIKKTIDLVKELLNEYKNFRDSDIELAKFIWEQEAFKRHNTTLIQMTLYTFLTCLKRGEFTSLESIGRSRRKCQEMYPELRGISYKRKKEIEKEVKQLINN